MASSVKGPRNKTKSTIATIVVPTEHISSQVEEFDADAELDHLLEEVEVTDPGSFDGPDLLVVNPTSARKRVRREV